MENTENSENEYKPEIAEVPPSLMKTPLFIELTPIAKIVYAAVAEYSRSLGHFHSNWDELSESLKESFVDGIAFVKANPHAADYEAHNRWYSNKIENGWKFGIVKDVEKKEHPCLVDFHELPETMKYKDRFLLTITRFLLDINI